MRRPGRSDVGFQVPELADERRTIPADLAAGSVLLPESTERALGLSNIHRLVLRMKTRVQTHHRPRIYWAIRRLGLPARQSHHRSD